MVVPMPPAPSLTPKGAATRARIVEAAAGLVLARGVGGTTLDDIRAGTSTSKSQLFHYFPGGKSDLLGALAAYQAERVLDAQRPFLDTLDTWEAWEGWRAALIAHYQAQPHWGCPIGSLVNELGADDPELQAEVADHLDRWRAHLEAGLRRMQANRLLSEECDPRRMSLAIFGAVQGGLLLTQTTGSIEPLEAAVDGAMIALRAAGRVNSPRSGIASTTRRPRHGR
jgi:AcrR family transcriptional regulator